MSGDQFTKEMLNILNERQQITYNELHDIANGMGLSENVLASQLAKLENEKAITSRLNGGILTYYMLQQDTLRDVLIVEDDKNINKLMALSIGKEFNISQIYDGGEALKFIRENKPPLVILDLMLPHKDGLDICQTIKSDPALKKTIVIIVSAMEPTSSRFKGIKYGADYYVKKPFDPKELRNLVVLFLKKKGKRFDPLIDLPDEERISKQIDKLVGTSNEYEIGTLKIKNLGAYATKFGEESTMVILRLISQLLQDMVKDDKSAFVGFLNSEVFILAGKRGSIQKAIERITEEFEAVFQFILQDVGYKTINLDIKSLYESKEVPRLSLIYEKYEKEAILKKRKEILKSKGKVSNDIGSYTYEEIQKMFGNDTMDIKITRNPDGIKMHLSKTNEDDDEQ